MRGKAFHTHKSVLTREDHPRLCGEKKCPGRCCLGSLGSPPPMRGKAINHLEATLSLGITPAYAGKRSACRRKRDFGRDHPRLCGEKCHPLLILRLHRGSPPPMRGKAHPATIIHDDSRITPAYAGKSRLLERILPPVRDHPRLCEEKSLTLSVVN